MADSNSKKPMALLLLVVVAVLVVIMVSGGDDFTSHADLTTQETCEAEGGAWTATMKDVADWTAATGTKETCEAASGTYTDAIVAKDAVVEVKDATTGEVTTAAEAAVAAADATCQMVDAEADPAGTCADDWANDATKEDCEAAHGVWTTDDAGTPEDDSDDTSSCGAAPAAE